jgi:hypothetical protein
VHLKSVVAIHCDTDKDRSRILCKKRLLTVLTVAYVERKLAYVKKFKSELNQSILKIKPTRCTNYSNLFWNETLHVSDSSSVHHQQLFTVHSAMVYVVQVCRQLSSSRISIELLFHPDPAAVRKLYDIYHCCVYSE